MRLRPTQDHTHETLALSPLSDPKSRPAFWDPRGEIFRPRLEDYSLGRSLAPRFPSLPTQYHTLNQPTTSPIPQPAQQSTLSNPRRGRPFPPALAAVVLQRFNPRSTSPPGHAAAAGVPLFPRFYQTPIGALTTPPTRGAYPCDGVRLWGGPVSASLVPRRGRASPLAPSAGGVNPPLVAGHSVPGVSAEPRAAWGLCRRLATGSGLLCYKKLPLRVSVGAFPSRAA